MAHDEGPGNDTGEANIVEPQEPRGQFGIFKYVVEPTHLL
jgi:hypothetical protein